MNKYTAAKILGMTVVLIGLSGLGKLWAFTNPVDATITVTPTATVSLNVSATTYAFGSVAVNISTTSGSFLTLTNDGQVGETVAKKIVTQSAPAGWTAGAAAGADTYALYVATAAVQPAAFAAGALLGALNNSTALSGDGGTSIGVMAPSGGTSTAKLWFKLFMPTSVTATTARTITVEFTGTGQ